MLALAGISPRLAWGRPPRRLDHTLKRNNYPDSVFNHDRSYSLEAGRLFIRVGCFPCEPKGSTCITLHFFTIFSAMFTSDTGTGRRGISLPVHTSRMTQAPALIRALATIPLIASREDTAGDLSGCCQKTVQTPNTGVYLSPTKV